MSPPSHLPPHPTLQLVTEPLFELPESHSKFPLAIYFPYGNISFPVTPFPCIPPSPTSLLPTSIILFSMSVSPLKVKVLVAQSCPILCDPMEYSLLGSSVHGILQSRILEWVVISFSRGSSQHRDQTHISYVSCTGRQVPYL